MLTDTFYKDVKASLKGISDDKLVEFYEGLSRDVASELRGHTLTEKVLTDIAKEIQKRGLTAGTV